VTKKTAPKKAAAKKENCCEDSGSAEGGKVSRPKSSEQSPGEEGRSDERHRSLEQKRENPMWYGNTKSLLESIVRWLRTEAPQNDADWQAQTDLVQACLAEMAEMSEPNVNPSKGATSRYVHRPVADKLNRAMPHVRAMLTAMRDRDPAMALAHGETTLRRL
jgi:hypothetical protein